MMPGERHPANNRHRLPPLAPGAVMKKIFLLLCLGMGAYKAYSYWEEQKAMQEYLDFAASRPKDRTDSKVGFIEAIAPEGVSPTVMTVFMPVGCPMAEGQRG